MALSKASLKSALEAFFGNLPSPCTHAACAQEWADALEDYASDVVPPSSAAAAAGAALQAALAAAFATPAAAAAMDAAFQTFATTLGAGMAPAFVATPPATPVGWPTLMLPPFETTHAGAAQKMADAIDAWMKTGTAVPSGGGAAAPWS